MINKVLCVLTTITISTACFAAQPNFKYYVGADVQGLRLIPTEFTNESKDRWGISGFGGYRWKDVAVEVGITGIQSEKYNGTGNGLVYTGDSKAFNIYADALLFKEIASKLEIKGLIGAGSLFTKTSFSAYTQSNFLRYSSQETAANIGLRLGAGLQYNFTQHINTSIMYKYQLTSDSFNNMQVIALALAYAF